MEKMTTVKYETIIEKAARILLEKQGYDVREVVFLGGDTDIRRVRAVIAVDIFSEIINAAKLNKCVDETVLNYLLKKQETLPVIPAAMARDVIFDRNGDAWSFPSGTLYPGLLTLSEALKTLFSACKARMDKEEYVRFVLYIAYVFDCLSDMNTGLWYFGGWQEELCSIAKDERDAGASCL